MGRVAFSLQNWTQHYGPNSASTRTATTSTRTRTARPWSCAPPAAGRSSTRTPVGRSPRTALPAARRPSRSRASVFGRQGYPNPLYLRSDAGALDGNLRILADGTQIDDNRFSGPLNADLRLAKSFKFGGRSNLTLSAEMFNALNSGTELKRINDASADTFGRLTRSSRRESCDSEHGSGSRSWDVPGPGDAGQGPGAGPVRMGNEHRKKRDGPERARARGGAVRERVPRSQSRPSRVDPGPHRPAPGGRRPGAGGGAALPVRRDEGGPPRSGPRRPPDHRRHAAGGRGWAPTGTRGRGRPGSTGWRRRACGLERAHAHNVVTLPSHANILSGRLPFQHGVRDNAGFRFPRARPRWPRA